MYSLGPHANRVTVRATTALLLAVGAGLLWPSPALADRSDLILAALVLAVALTIALGLVSTEVATAGLAALAGQFDAPGAGATPAVSGVLMLTCATIATTLLRRSVRTAAGSGRSPTA